MEQYYKILGLSPKASAEEIKRAFRQLAKQWHPDLFFNDPIQKKKAEEKFKQINEAYTKLSTQQTTLNNFADSKNQPEVRVQRLDPERLYQQGVIYAEQEKYEEAIEEFSQAIRCDQTFIKAYQYRGFILDKLGYKQRAEADFRKTDELKLHKNKTSQKSDFTNSYTDNNQQESQPCEVKTSEENNNSESDEFADKRPKMSQTQWHCTFINTQSTITTITLNRAQTLFAIGYQDGMIHILELKTQKHITAFCGHSGAIRSLVFTPDGERLISGSDDKTIRSHKLNVSAPLVLGRGNLKHVASITALVLSPDGKVLVSGSADKTVKIWHLGQNSDPFTLTGFASKITSLDISPDGKNLAVGSLDKNIRIRRIQDGKVVSSFKIDSGVSILKFSPNGKKIVTGEYNHAIKMWDLDTRESIGTFVGHKDLISALAFTTDGQQLVSSSWDGTIRFWEVSKQKNINILRGHTDAIKAMAYADKYNYLITSSLDKRLGIWKSD
jgi:curved DNA-binding protein CbpA